MSAFNPQRLTIARERRAESKAGLAGKANLAANTINRYESGEITPSQEVVERIAEILNFSTKFFFGPDIDRPRRENASFRGLASKSARVMDAALASGSLAYLFDDWIGQRYQRPEPSLPDFKEGMPPELAAKLLRQEWRLGDMPIENMVHLLESKGIRVFSLAENTKDVDAFSVWRDDIPYIFLNTYKSSERSRFDAAHELAHLCLHKHGGAVAELKNSAVEKEANAFAGAFLMPEADLRATIKSTIYSADDLLLYKRRWRVAAAALAYRALEVGIIKDSRSNSLYVEMSRRGWLKSEPDGIVREKSHVWQYIFDDLRSSSVTKHHISHETGVPIRELEALLFGLANMLTIEGKGLRSPTKKAHLSLVD